VWLKRGARWAGGQRNSLDASSESSTSGASAAGWFFETGTMIRSRLIGRLESSGAHSGQAASTTPTMPRRSASDMCAFDMCSATKTVSGCASRNASRTSGKVSSCVGHPTRREGGEARRPRSGEPRSRCDRERPAFCGRPQKCRARLGQAHVAGRAPEQLDIQFLLELPDGCAERWLCRTEALGGAAEVALFGYGDEVPQVSVLEHPVLPVKCVRLECMPTARPSLVPLPPLTPARPLRVRPAERSRRAFFRVRSCRSRW